MEAKRRKENASEIVTDLLVARTFNELVEVLWQHFYDVKYNEPCPHLKPDYEFDDGWERVGELIEMFELSNSEFSDTSYELQSLLHEAPKQIVVENGVIYRRVL